MDAISVLEQLRADNQEMIDKIENQLIKFRNEKIQHYDTDPNYNKEIILYNQYALIIYKTADQVITVLERKLKNL